ncbi:uncharacterized protein si:dkey-9i23.16 [Anoplopoma fimbria]|uniref:uncharacterized protein si:dkey-9i23.16 n=1 Tax=Anoplopoma fimbria TaxID=229290 RepID=UPI0023ECB00A|nr:uncharacterized protein si:dkey-9i23.16 [Anoplopoma fimbria]XP_054460423.1 uncharacterized protein si:dkey-9i23.16 [Anoplopoma fimbria]
MSSPGVVEPRAHRLSAWFDHEAAAVLTILMGLFQVFLSVPLAYAHMTLPKLFILPLVLGVIIVIGGSFTIANERNSSRLKLRGCACSNVVGLLGALLAFCLYCYFLNTVSNTETCEPSSHQYDYRPYSYQCPGELLAAYCWSLVLLLLLYDIGAVVLHGVLTVSALKDLKTD